MQAKIMYKMKRLLQISTILFLAVAWAQSLNAQGNSHPNTGANFLMITPDARGAALGSLGAATSPDAASSYWNPSKYMFVDSKAGGSLSCTPWQKNIVDGINLLNLSSYYKIDDMQAVNLSISYMSYSDVYVRNDYDMQMQSQRIGEYAISGGYLRKLSVSRW